MSHMENDTVRAHQEVAPGTSAYPPVLTGPTVCNHDGVDWNPVEIDYGPDRVANITQWGKCRECKAEVTQFYAPMGISVVER